MKTYDLPIVRNPLRSRDDVASSLIDILTPCEDALVLGGAGLFVGNGSAHYGPRGALLEGWSRLLWGIAPLRAGGYSWKGETRHAKGLVEGTDPESENYWGDVKDFDQRMVEMAAISLSLLLCPQDYWEPLDKVQRENLATWLNMINTHEMSCNNWLFFRVLVNLALEQLGRKEFDPQGMEEALVRLEGMYAANGWYRDQVPFDNYNPFAMQFYSLVYYAFKKDADKERCRRFAERVRLFAGQHIYFFDEEGAYVPYGRSLTYRFAVVSFYSACAFAGLEVLPWGVMKGIVLRNLRWWFRQPIFDRDGFLTVGFANPTMIFGEQYNAPGSPYWALKTYLVLALDENHPFWKSEELPLPKLERTKVLEVPKTIMQRTDDDDVVMLNAGQNPTYHMMHMAEKYAKFAYSAHYGFSTSSSYCDFEKCGCDSMLYFSEDGEYWRPRTRCDVLHVGPDYLHSSWHPFADVSVSTYLVPYGNYHVRVHEIKTGRAVWTKEGGFAIPLYRGMEQEQDPLPVRHGDSSVAICMPWDTSLVSDPLHQRTAEPVRPTPNLNLMAEATVVPVLSARIERDREATFVTLVGAHRGNGRAFVDDAPSVSWNGKSRTLTVGTKTVVLGP
jgi:hypothetical protein